MKKDDFKKLSLTKKKLNLKSYLLYKGIEEDKAEKIVDAAHYDQQFTIVIINNKYEFEKLIDCKGLNSYDMYHRDSDTDNPYVTYTTTTYKAVYGIKNTDLVFGTMTVEDGIPAAIVINRYHVNTYNVGKDLTSKSKYIYIYDPKE